MVEVKYRAVYEREPDGRWTVELPQVKGCHTYGRTIDQARERIREALDLFVENAETAEIVDDVRLPPGLMTEVKRARRLREQVIRDEKLMTAAQARVVVAMRKLKLGHRDAGHILGLSHQRVQQLEKRHSSTVRMTKQKAVRRSRGKVSLRRGSEEPRSHEAVE